MNMIIIQYDGKYEMLYLHLIGIHFVITEYQRFNSELFTLIKLK